LHKLNRYGLFTPFVVTVLQSGHSVSKGGFQRGVHVHVHHASVFGNTLFAMLYEKNLPNNDPFLVTKF